MCAFFGSDANHDPDSMALKGVVPPKCKAFHAAKVQQNCEITGRYARTMEVTERGNPGGC